ncbi:putative zinc protease-like protein y4wB [Nymphon striatum]|nr:putative zinc protease-like protein y4wB [Nymphon striatum]
MKWFVAIALTVLTALPSWADIDIQEITTPAGFNAWLVEEQGIPFVALELRFKGGASLDRPDKRGETNLMVGLLEEGAGDLDARGFAQRLEELAATFSYDVHDDGVSISAKFLSENRDQAVELLRQSLISPRFDDADVERVRAQVLSGIRSDEKDPDSIANRTFDAMAFGDHPYATSLDGTTESVNGLTRDDLVSAHQGAMAKDRVYISAAGDISADELTVLIDNLLADLPETGRPLPGPAEITLTGGVEVVPFKTPQSVAVFGHQGLERHDP